MSLKYSYKSCKLPKHSPYHNKSLLGIHVALAFSLLGIQSHLAFSLLGIQSPWHSVTWHSVALAFNPIGIRSPWRLVAWHSVAVPLSSMEEEEMVAKGVMGVAAVDNSGAKQKRL